MHNLEKSKVLVTGGCGFIGSHIVDRLVELGADVYIVDNLESGKLDNISQHSGKVRFFEKDIKDDNFISQILKEVDYLCHQAALRSVPKSVDQPLEYHEVNVTATLKLFLKAKEFGIKRVVFASSSSVYGDRVDFPEKETDFPMPVSPYACTKLLIENYAYMFKKLYNFDIVSLRYFNVFGPRQSLENEYAVVVPKFINSILNNQKPPIYGDGNQERDFTYVQNVVDANIAALTKENIGGEVFNVALGVPYSVNQLFNFLKEIVSSDITPTYLPKRQGDVYKTCADITKLKDILGVVPRVDFKSGLQKTVDWFINNRKK